MSDQTVRLPSDPILLAYLQAADEVRAQHLLADLLANHASAVMKQIIRYKLRTAFHPHDEATDGADAEDVYSSAVVSLLARLRELKAHPESVAIHHFRGYVATLTYNACSKHLREKYPQRHSLKNKLRYLFTHQPELSLWQDANGNRLCGYATWKTHPCKAASRGELYPLLEAPHRWLPTICEPANDGALIDLARAALDHLGAPIEIDDLVNLIAELTGVKDHPLPDGLNEASEPQREAASAEPHSAESALEQRAYLEHLWREICQLPLRQRTALLLNLKDEQGGNSLALFPLTGVASLRQIAAAMELSLDELTAFWNDLPLEDLVIAERLHLSRQQIINLRKCARERLHRKMQGKWG